MPLERMYLKDHTQRGHVFYPLHPQKTTSKGNEFQNIRLINQYHWCEKHCTKPVTLVANQLLIGIFTPNHFPARLRETS